MVKLTMIARVTDGLPLAEGLDDGRDQKDLEFYKQQAKQLCKRLSQQKQGASRMSVETGPYFFQYPLSLSLSLSLCACSGSLHLGFVAFSACSQIFVWRVCL
jgi:vesicle transport protein SEC22